MKSASLPCCSRLRSPSSSSSSVGSSLSSSSHRPAQDSCCFPALTAAENEHVLFGNRVILPSHKLTQIARYKPCFTAAPLLYGIFFKQVEIFVYALRKKHVVLFLPSFLSIFFSFLLPSQIQPKSPVIISASPRLSFFSAGDLNVLYRRAGRL